MSLSLKRVFNRWRFHKTLDTPGACGETALTLAVRGDDVDGALRFINLGANVNQPNAAGELPIFIAIENKNPKMFQLLVEEGANLRSVFKGRSLIETAVAAGMRDEAAIAASIDKTEESSLYGFVAAPVPVVGFPPPRATTYANAKEALKKRK